MAYILLWRVHDSQAYRKMDVTRERISHILELRNTPVIPEAEFRGEKLGTHFMRHVQFVVLSVINNRRENSRVSFKAQFHHVHGGGLGES